MSKTVLITGCSSGFGKLAAKKFHNERWNVIATMRTPSKEVELAQLDNVLVTRLDVTDNDSILEAVNKGLEKFGSIDVLVNNAGYGGHGFVEQFTEDQIYNMFNTNVFGVIRVSKAVLPHMRKQRSGTIINVTSVAGHVGMPNTSTYCASKHAVEGLSESMAHEYKHFNIGVKTVGPGAYGTNFTASTKNNLETGDNELQERAHKITQHFATLVKQMENIGGKKADPQEVADKIYECATTNAPVHNIIGADAEMVMGMKDSMSSQEFFEKISEMITPPED